MNEDANKKDSPAETGTPRRSERVLLNVPILVQGGTTSRQPFQEETHTLVVNAHGALITMATQVRPGDTLMILNKNTQEVELCRVAFLGPTHAGKTQVGIEFTRPAANFWRTSLAPEDWRVLPD